MTSSEFSDRTQLDQTENEMPIPAWNVDLTAFSKLRNDRQSTPGSLSELPSLTLTFDASQSVFTGVRNYPATKELLKLIDDPTKQKEVDLLVDLLTDEDVRKQVGARNVLSLLAEQRKPQANEILRMLSNPADRELAEKLLRNLQKGEIPLFLGLLSQKDTKQAAELLGDLLDSDETSDNDIALGLINSLGSKDPEVRKDAEQMLLMLNSERHRATAMRILQGRQRRG